MTAPRVHDTEHLWLRNFEAAVRAHGVRIKEREPLPADTPFAGWRYHLQYQDRHSSNIIRKWWLGDLDIADILAKNLCTKLLAGALPYEVEPVTGEDGAIRGPTRSFWEVNR